MTTDTERDELLKAAERAINPNKLLKHGDLELLARYVRDSLAAGPSGAAEAVAAENDGDLELIRERDNAEEWADKLAAIAGDEDVIGEHSNLNNPWANALDILQGMRDSMADAAEVMNAATDFLDDLRDSDDDGQPPQCVHYVEQTDERSRSMPTESLTEQLAAACKSVLEAKEYDGGRWVGKLYDAKLTIDAALARYDRDKAAGVLGEHQLRDETPATLEWIKSVWPQPAFIVRGEDDSITIESAGSNDWGLAFKPKWTRGEVRMLMAALGIQAQPDQH